MKPAILHARLPFYYGWVVIGVAFVTMAFAVNARTSFSLLFPPILDEFGWDRGVTAAAFSIGFVASTAIGPVLGVLMDRVGPQLVIPLAAVSVAIGFFFATYVETPLGLYVTFGLLVVGGSIGMSYYAHAMFLANWFVRRRGLALGVAFSGVGVGAIFILPWVQSVIEADGWRTACLALAVILLVVLVPMNALLQRQRPAVLGLEPDGGQGDADAARRHAETIVDRAWVGVEWTFGKAVRTGRFWWVFAGYFCALFAWYAVQVHQTKYFIDSGFSADVAAMSLGLVGLFGIAGQIGVGALSDRIGREWAWTIALSGYVICSSALMLLEGNPSTVILWVVIASQGLLGYGLSAMYGVISFEIFGGLRFASIFAVLGLGGNLGAAAGPWLTGYIFDLSGSYATGFILCAALSVVSIVCIWIAAPRKVRLAAGPAARRALRDATSGRSSGRTEL